MPLPTCSTCYVLYFVRTACKVLRLHAIISFSYYSGCYILLAIISYILPALLMLCALLSMLPIFYIISAGCEVLMLLANQCVTCYLLKNVLIHATIATCYLVIARSILHATHVTCSTCYVLWFVRTACKVLRLGAKCYYFFLLWLLHTTC